MTQLKGLINNIQTQPMDESHWKFRRGEEDLIKHTTNGMK